MNLAVFGGTGGVGREVVTQALDAGHHVTAYVRNPSKLDVAHSNLTVAAGELTDGDAVQRAVHGADAVISALGPSLDRKATGMPLVDGTRTIVDAMRAEGVERYIGMATPSLRDPRDKGSLLGRIVPFMGRTFLARAYRELLDMAQLVTDSPLNWTIARFTRPTDGPGTGTVRAGYLGRDRIRASITRSDIARFLLDQTADSHLDPRSRRISGRETRKARKCEPFS
jgi:putative NADH-flavin reductase